MTAPARDQVLAELMKIRTTRLWWPLVGGVVLVTGWSLLRNGAMHHYDLYPPLDRLPPTDRAAAVARAAAARTPAGRTAAAADMLTAGRLAGVLLAMLLGTLVVTNEYAHRTAVATFLTNPHRGVVVAAKLVAAAAAGALLWAASTAVALVVTPIYLRGQHIDTALLGGIPLRSVLLNLLGYTMWAAFGVGLGSLFRSQAGAVATGMTVYLGGAAAVVLAFDLVHLAYHHAWVLAAPVIAPAVASLVMVTPGRAFEHAPPQWAGLLVMTGYVLLLGTAGVLRTRSRDI